MIVRNRKREGYSSDEDTLQDSPSEIKKPVELQTLSTKEFKEIREIESMIISNNEKIPWSDEGSTTDVDSDIARQRKIQHAKLKEKDEKRNHELQLKEKGIILYNNIFSKTQQYINIEGGLILIYAHFLQHNLDDPKLELHRQSYLSVKPV